MNYINIGKYSNTHGINGEIRIISDFSRKDLVFVPNNKIYIGNDKLEYVIKTYRKHKNYDMVRLNGINNINDIEYLKGSYVYINKEDLKVDYLIEDFINYSVLIDNLKYKIKDIIENNKYKILVLENNSMIPLIEEFIIHIDKTNKEIIVKKMEGLINED